MTLPSFPNSQVNNVDPGGKYGHFMPPTRGKPMCKPGSTFFGIRHLAIFIYQLKLSARIQQQNHHELLCVSSWHRNLPLQTWHTYDLFHKAKHTCFPFCFTLKLEDVETLIIYRYNECAWDGHLNITPELFNLTDHHNLNHHTPHLQIHFKLQHSLQVIYFKATRQMLHRNDMIN